MREPLYKGPFYRFSYFWQNTLPLTNTYFHMPFKFYLRKKMCSFGTKIYNDD